ncbi:Sulfoquinovose isomerase [Nocardiopsis dassonvillei]
MTVTQRPPGDPGRLREEEARLRGFAAASAVADGFGALDARGRVEPDRPVQTWITARMTHVFSLAHLRGDADAAELADHGVRALARGPLRDGEQGGWFDEVPRERSQGRKSAYPHTFVALAAASAAVAGCPGARELLDEALAVIEERFWDESAGALLESWDADWTGTEDYRGANSNMHAVEAFLAAADATGDTVWTRRALSIAERLVHGVAADHDWRLPEHFTADWKPLPDYNRDLPDHPFRPFGSTTGHLLEWARLLVHLEIALDRAGEPAPAWLRTDARALFSHAVERGWNTDGAEGFVYTLDWNDRPVVRERMHWVAAEATMAAWALALHTGDRSLLEYFELWWDYAERYHLDFEHGSWHHELDPDNRPAATVWPGKPDVYHAYQATLLPQLPLSVSLAAAVREHTAPHLVVVGENVMDLLPVPGEPGLLRAAPGGGPANTAVAARRLGVPTRFLARIGADGFGRAIRHRLAVEGLDPEGLLPAEEPSALALARLGVDGSAVYDFRMDDAADWRWRSGELPEELEPGVRALHAASLALFREPGAGAVEALLRREHGRGRVTISVDPNIRPGVIGDPDTARVLALRDLAQAHVVKASDEDLAFLYPDRNTEEAAAAVADLGPSLVVVTRGAEGAFALAHGVRAEAAAPRVRVVDTVGAGDTFMGALLSWLDGRDRLGEDPRARLAGLTKEELEEMLSFAARAAAVTVTREGADPPTGADLEREGS